MRIARILEHDRWDRVFSVVTCVGVPWQLRPDQRSLVRLVVPEAEADQGVAPVIVMPAAQRTDRRRYVTKRDLVKYGYTDECQACMHLESGMHNAKVLHDDRCRDRIGELMAEDDDQRQVERVFGTLHPEVETRVREPEKRWTLVSQRLWEIYNQSNNLFPKFEWADHRVQEPELDQPQEQMKRT